MKKEYQTIILGATFQGCSLAAGKEDCLILEHSIHAGSDFIYSALPGIAPLREPCFPESRELQEDLISAKALTENGMQMAALAPYFSKWCLKEKLNILFSADPIAVKENIRFYRMVKIYYNMVILLRFFLVFTDILYSDYSKKGA